MDGPSRAARAKALGFTTVAYHGTGAKFNEFQLGKPSVIGGHGVNFADDPEEARGYAKEKGRKGHVLTCLLRVRKSFPVWYGDDTLIPAADYKKIVGRPADPKDKSALLGKNIFQELERQIGWEDKLGFWNEVYRRLAAAGYDALYYKRVPGDHIDAYYNKFIVFDPRNIRLIDAAFDPAKSDSADLLA